MSALLVAETRLAAASDKDYQLLAHGRWFSPGTPASSTTKTGRHDIAKILLKMGLKHQKSNQINLLAIVLSTLLRFTLLIILWHLQNILVNNKVLRCCINIQGYFYHT
jgi:hypothetical protein